MTLTAKSLPDVDPEITSHDYSLTRRGNLHIRVQDANGEPAENAQVFLLQTGHEFWFDDETETAEEKAEGKLILDQLHKIEQDYKSEEEAMMIRLIKIRESLWT